jgi:hypothetical protein
MDQTETICIQEQIFIADHLLMLYASFFQRRLLPVGHNVSFRYFKFQL